VVYDEEEDESANDEDREECEGRVVLTVEEFSDGEEGRPDDDAAGDPAEGGEAHVVAVEVGIGF